MRPFLVLNAVALLVFCGSGGGVGAFQVASTVFAKSKIGARARSQDASHGVLLQESATLVKDDAIATPTTSRNASSTMQMTDGGAPGLDEDSKFDCDASVAFWKTFQVTPDEVPERLQNIVRPYLISGDAQARSYWLYHMVRSGYFSSNAVIGTLAHVAHERFVKQSDATASPFANGNAFARLGMLLTEAFLSYEQNYRWIEAGLLNYPWDAAIQANGNLQLDHKQSNPVFAIQETSRLVRESISVWGRRTRLEGKPAGVWLESSSSTKKESKDAQNHLYPDYYLNDFHYQTDGWLSSESAERYEVSTETLFLGRQDAMQRQTLVPLKQYFQQKSDDDAPATMLEVACGTGRYATFARDNFPTTQMTLVDLSPFYLEKAKKNDEYWRKYRGETAMKLAGATSSEEEVVPAPDTTRFVQANAEKLPFADNSFAAVTSVYLFHELPTAARERAAAEMARVCKPGGMVVFSDSLQIGDRPPLDKVTPLDGFSKLNEPHYETYLSQDIPALFEKHGLKCSTKYMNSRTKTLSFIKDAET